MSEYIVVFDGTGETPEWPLYTRGSSTAQAMVNEAPYRYRTDQDAEPLKLPKRRRKYDAEAQTAAIALRDSGQSFKQISLALGMPLSTVHQIVTARFGRAGAGESRAVSRSGGPSVCQSADAIATRASDVSTGHAIGGCAADSPFRDRPEKPVRARFNQEA